MRTAEEKAEMLRAQVFSKVRWGARDQEVLDWLKERHKMSGDEAQALMSAAHRAKRKAVRSKALLTLVFASFGILLAVGFVGLQLWEGLFVIGYGSILVMVVGFVSIGVFFRNLHLAFSGETDGAVD